MKYDNRNKSKKSYELGYFLRETITIPKDDPDVSPRLHNFIHMIEGNFRRGKISRPKVGTLLNYLKDICGLSYRIIDDFNMVVIPRSRYFYKEYFKYPNLVLFIGNRHSGKTIAGWDLALKFLEEYPEGEIWVYGDVDGIGERLIDMGVVPEEKLFIKFNFRLPPIDLKRRILFFNELSEEIMSGSGGGLMDKIKIRVFRSRHNNSWVIFNVIRYQDLQATLRDSSDYKIYKWTTAELLSGILDALPLAYKEIVKISPSMKVNEGLASLPIKGEGVYFHILPIDPDPRLLEAGETAKKNIEVMQDDYIPELKEILESRARGESYVMIASHTNLGSSKIGDICRVNKKKIEDIKAQVKQ